MSGWVDEGDGTSYSGLNWEGREGKGRERWSWEVSGMGVT